MPIASHYHDAPSSPDLQTIAEQTPEFKLTPDSNLLHQLDCDYPEVGAWIAGASSPRELPDRCEGLDWRRTLSVVGIYPLGAPLHLLYLLQ